MVIQLGDLLDAKAWSRWPKDGDDCPEAEFEAAYKGLEKLHEMFPKMHILTGNHDLRFRVKATESNLPSRMIKGLEEVLPFKGWKWYVDPKEKLIVDSKRGPIIFVHGDEDGGTPIAKACALGMNLVQGHTHKASIEYRDVMGELFFGAEAGHLMDHESRAAAYSARKAVGMCAGFLVIEEGIPRWIPA